MTITDELVQAHIARNVWHAAAIERGLHLADLHNNLERMKRARLYRAWRDAGEPPSVAFQRAIAGKPAPAELQLLTS